MRSASICGFIGSRLRVKVKGEGKMGTITMKMHKRKKIALIAHDNRKQDLLEWVRFNKDSLAEHELYATGTTGRLLAGDLGLKIACFKSGPLGGDQQVGAKIAEGDLDFIVFMWDPLQPHPHDVDVKALLRIAVVYNVPIACNRATADFMISSPLMEEEYDRILIDYDERISRVKQ
jgi:methylglyoxal synthase